MLAMLEQNDPSKEPGEPLDGWREPYGPWKVDPGDGLSEFEAAVLEEVLNAPADEYQFTGDDRLVTEDEWFWTIAGNA
jgi:hypothetical protein